MKKLLPLLVVTLVTLLAVLWVGSKLLTPRDRSPYHAEDFGRLPVLVNGRIKPLDTVARTSLLFLQNKQTYSDPQGTRLEPVEWLLDVLYRPDVADDYRHFRIDNLETLALCRLGEDDTRITYDSPAKRTLAALGFAPSSIHRFSFNQLRAGFDAIQKEAESAHQLDNSQRSAFQREVITLNERLMLYHRLKHSVQLPQSPDFAAELGQFAAVLPAGVAATRARMQGDAHDESAVRALATFVNRFEFLANVGYLLPVPPTGQGQEVTAWTTVGASLLGSLASGELAPQVKAYAAMGRAYRARDAAGFNREVDALRASFDQRFAEKLDKAALEFRFNHAQPFYLAIVLFVASFLVGICSWLRWPAVLGPIAANLALLAVVVTTAGIVTRMYLESRPPVTNLYSSALFVGWVAAALGLVLERIYRNGVGVVGGSLIGFGCLIVAHNLSFGGDTLEMMRAVLDDNFWLATHVVTITVGYGAMFVAGILGVLYVVMGVFTGWLNRPFSSVSPETNGQALARMVYGITCFATLFSLVGTILGGIWADQSWGRFWGWDPKENGALIIVLWCAIVLHARWGGLVRQRGLMNLAIFGNIVTGWSWFGVNLLGVGLHSYGFTSGAFTALAIFWLANLAVIGLGLLPLHQWRSFAAAKPD